MTTGQRVSLNTFLGNCLEELAASAIAELSVAFQRSPPPPKGLISPDFLRVDPPPIFIAVTSTPTRNTFQKKKWRYVHEVFSNKQYYKPRPFAVNLQLSPSGALQPNDEKIIRGFFDAEVRPAATLLDAAIASLRQEYERSDGNAKRALHALRKEPHVTRLESELSRLLKNTIREPRENQAALWACVQRFAGRDVRRAVKTLRVQSEQTNLRAVCFGSILIRRERVGEYLRGLASNKRLLDADARQLRDAGVSLTSAINGHIAPSYFSHTVRTFGVPLLVDTISQLTTSNEASHIIRDLTEPQSTRARTGASLAFLKERSPNHFAHAVLEEFASAKNARKPRRVEILDYAILCSGISSTAVDRAMSSGYDDFTAMNRVQCLISSGGPGRAGYAESLVQAIAERVWKYLRENTDVVDQSIDQAFNRVVQSRQQSLKLLGAEVNPAQHIFEALCQTSGVRFELTSLPSSIGDIGVGGRVAKVERIYRLETSPNRYVKVLSGYKGGYEHKAEELAARGWILRYRRGTHGWRRNDMNLGFVHEGDWDESYLDLMLRSGWDWQCPLEDVVKDAANSAPDFVRRLEG